MSKIEIDIVEFKTEFSEFEEVEGRKIISASKGVSSFISNETGTINLPVDLQIRGNYLATAHILALTLNPSLANGILSSVGQGSENLHFQNKPIKNIKEYNLNLTIYGMQLLTIIEQVQPPLLNKRTSPYPYYNQ